MGKPKVRAAEQWKVAVDYWSKLGPAERQWLQDYNTTVSKGDTRSARRLKVGKKSLKLFNHEAYANRNDCYTRAEIFGMLDLLGVDLGGFG